MASLSSFKTPNSLHIFSTKALLSTSSSISTKLKALYQTFIFSQMHRVFRPFAKAKTLLLDLLQDINNSVELPVLLKKKNKKKKKKLLFASFRLHYNWCSSHVMPLPHQTYRPHSHIYYDASWNRDRDRGPAEELARYLEWLEEKESVLERSGSNEIDELADLFIANCHEKFRLEKQESYRRFQEMLARSV